MELTRKNYFSKEAESLYLGSSSFKAWDVFKNGCEARELAKKEGRWEEKNQDALLLGSYVHAWSSGDLKEFMVETPELFKKDGTLYAKYALGDEMINVLKNDPLVEKIREGEKEKIFTGKIGGIDFKIQVDILNLEKGYFADIKTTKNLQESYWIDGKKGTFIDKYDYYTQMAIYSEILKQNTGLDKYLDSYLIVVDKQEHPDHEVIYMGKGFIEERLIYIESRLPEIMEVRQGLREPIACGKCDYCRSTKKVKKPISLSEYEESVGVFK